MELNQGTYGALCQVWDAEVRFVLRESIRMRPLNLQECWTSRL